MATDTSSGSDDIRTATTAQPLGTRGEASMPVA